MCEEAITHIKLAGEGTLTLGERCSLDAENIRLISKSSFGTASTELIIPDIDMRSFPINLSNENLDLSNMSSNPLNATNGENEVVQLRAMLHSQEDKQLVKRRELDYHDVHHYSLIYILILVVIIYLYNVNYKKGNNSNTPKPAKRELISMPKITNDAGENVGNDIDL